MIVSKFFHVSVASECTAIIELCWAYRNCRGGCLLLRYNTLLCMSDWRNEFDSFRQLVNFLLFGSSKKRI